MKWKKLRTWRRTLPKSLRNLTEANKSLERSEYSGMAFSESYSAYIFFVELIWEILIQGIFSLTGLN